MIDIGLTSGIKDLWQEDLLRDYTLIAKGREFQVHKVVLAAVSKYFKAMLAEPYMESKVDRGEVKGFSADIVGKLLEFIYTSDENIIAGDTLGILQCAIYLQMPMVAKFCVKKLMENLNIRNCPEILSAMIEYSFQQEVLQLKNFVKTNFDGVVDNFNPEVISYEAVLVLIELWQRSEWEKFLCLKNWISVNYEDSRAYVNQLMTQVWFYHIGVEELQTITQMDLFTNTEGSWQDLVEKAVKYHLLPINLKVLDKSEQSRVNAEPSPLYFATDTTGSSTEVTQLYALDKEKNWRKCQHKGFTASDLGRYTYSICLEVNNFLIVCMSGNGNQKWQIFDPRALTWSNMPCMEKPKMEFEMVHHKDILYTVGGIYTPDIPSGVIEQYSFLTNHWSTIHPMPTSLTAPSACVLKDTLYVSNGFIRDKEAMRASKRLFSLDLSSFNPEWELKAPSLYEWCNKMFVVSRKNEDVLFLINEDLEMQCYIPSKDQWMKLFNNQIPDIYGDHWIEDGAIIARGNTIFILNVSTPVFDEDDDDVIDRIPLTWRWKIPEKGSEISELISQDFPRKCTDHNFSAMLAIPPEHPGHKVAIMKE